MGLGKSLSVLAGLTAAALVGFAADTEAKTLRYITFKPQAANDAHSISLQWFVDEFKKRTGGEHEMEVFWGGSVAGQREIPDALETGVGDIGDIVGPYFQDQMPLNNVVTFFQPQPNSEVELGQKLVQWYDKYPQFDEEMKRYNMKIVGWRPLEDYGLICRQPVRSPEDLKGLRIRSYGHALPRVFEAFGATPVSMATAEAYEALERGILDCSPTGVTLARGWRYEEVAKYYVRFPLGANWGHFIAMNRESYDSLDEQTRAILDGLGREYVIQYVNTLYDLTDQILEEWKDTGVEVIAFPEQAMAEAVESEGVQQARQEWIQRAGEMGLPSAEMAEFFAYE